MKETLHFDETLLGTLISIGWVGAVVGSLLYAWWLKSLPTKKLLYGAVLLSAVNILALLLIKNVASAWWVISLGGILGCLTLLPLMAASAMLTHGSGVEGTLFAVLMSLYNLSQIIFGFIGGQLFKFVGLYPLIFGAALLSLCGLLVIPKLDFENNERT